MCIRDRAITQHQHVRFFYDGKLRTVYPVEIKPKGKRHRMVLYGYEREHLYLSGPTHLLPPHSQIKSFALDKIGAVEIL